jgi:gluconokinase
VLSCSALKNATGKHCWQAFRADFTLGDYDLIWGRMKNRPEHYMKPDMLNSQFESFEEPVNGLVVDASLPVDEIVEEVLAHVAIMDDV